MSERGLVGPYRGFEHAELAVHVPAVGKRALQHYGKWLDRHARHREATKGFSPLLAAEPGGETGAPETRINPIPRDWYHTDWVADRTIAYLDSLPDDADWFVWMSFPDPHHPWDPPASERTAATGATSTCRPGTPASNEEIERVLDAEARALARALERRRSINAEGGPGTYRPQNVTSDNIREINAMAHIMNEMIDEACGRVLRRSRRARLGRRHRRVLHDRSRRAAGRLRPHVQGPVPHRLADAAADGVAAGAVGRSLDRGVEISEPVGQLDLAPTFCEIAGVPQPEWMRGRAAARPRAGNGRERVLCEWDSQFPGYGMHLRSIYRDGWLCTAYEPSTVGEPNGLEEFFAATGMFGGGIGPVSSIEYDGTEGELYNVEEDPHQWENRWDDPACKARARRPRRRPLRQPAEGTQGARGRAPGLTPNRRAVARRRS